MKKKLLLVGIVLLVFAGMKCDVVAASLGDASVNGSEVVGSAGLSENPATDFTYTISDGSVTITGYQGTRTEVVIPEKIEDSYVTIIGDYAFAGCSLTAIEIPDKVTSIGNYAFAGCGITAIEIPDKVTSIGNYAFTGCGLTGIEIPDNVTTIGESAFYLCSSLTNVVLPSGITVIAESTFSDCSKLTAIEIPDGVTSIGKSAFCGCTCLESVEIPGSVTNIGDNVFMGCYGLTDVVIPYSVTSIGSQAFYCCKSLASIVIPVSVTSIGKDAFFDYGREFYIYGEKGSYAQTYATQNKITFRFVENPASDFTYTISEEGVIITGYQGTRTDVVIPEKIDAYYVIGIAEGTFEGCSSLSSVEIPDSVTRIGDSAFYGCTDLTEIMIPKTVVSIGAYAVGVDCLYDSETGEKTSCPIEGFVIIGEKGSCAQTYAKQNGITFESVRFDENPATDFQYTISDGSVTITGYKGTATEVVIPKKIEEYYVTSIGASAFYKRTDLTGIELPDSVTSIGNSAFSGCKNLTDIEIDDSVTTIGTSAFSGCSSLIGIELGDGVTTIGDFAFSGCSNLIGIEIGDSVTTIGAYAFSGCSSLTDIEIGDGVTTIGAYAFSGCSSLTGIELPDSVTRIDSHAFGNCTGLTDIKLPDSVTSIGDYTFENCSSLTGIELPDSVTSIGEDAFRGCTRLSSVELGDGVTSIGFEAFFKCSSLTDIEIPDSVTSIGDYAFENCNSLTGMKIPASVTEIGECALGYLYDEDEGTDSLLEGFVIYGEEGSCAQTYSNENGIKFSIMSGSVSRFLTYHPDGGVNDERNVAEYVKSEEAIPLYAPAKAGYLFKGWYTDEQFTTLLTEIPAGADADYDLYAKWEFLYEEYGYSVTIGGNFYLKYYIRVGDALLNDNTAYIQFTVGDIKQQKKCSYIDNGYAVYICEVTPAQLTETVFASLHYNEQEYLLGDYSVYAYLNEIVANADKKAEYAEAQNIAKAILNYGGYAQEYFGCNTANLANREIDASVVTNLSDADAIAMIGTKHLVKGSLDTVQFGGYSLTCESDTILNVYYSLSETMTAASFAADYGVDVIGGGNAFEVSVSGNTLRVQVKDISAVELNHIYQISIDNGEDELIVKTSPFEYIRSAINGTETTESLKNLCKAMLLYNKAAEEYYSQYSIPAK